MTVQMEGNFSPQAQFLAESFRTETFLLHIRIQNLIQHITRLF